MGSAPMHPLRPSRDERRALLSRYFLTVVEPMLEAGEDYADLSVARLIKAANVSRSTFYAYFKDKGELLAAMASDMVADISEHGASWWEFPADGSRDDLRRALLPAIEAFRQHRAMFGAVLAAAGYDPVVRGRRRWLIDDTAAALASHISAGQGAGTIAPDLDPERTAALLIRMIEAGLTDLAGPAAPDEAERVIDAITDVLWRTLYAGPRS
jgi:AcrR family transcriptional regulator